MGKPENETEELIHKEFVASVLSGVGDMLLVYLIYIKATTQLDMLGGEIKRAKEEQQAVVPEV